MKLNLLEIFVKINKAQIYNLKKICALFSNVLTVNQIKKINYEWNEDETEFILYYHENYNEHLLVIGENKNDIIYGFIPKKGIEYKITSYNGTNMESLISNFIKNIK